MVRVTRSISSGDAVPLNKSFDTVETSSMYSEDLFSRDIMTALSVDEVDPSASSNTELKVRPPETFDLQAHEAESLQCLYAKGSEIFRDETPSCKKDEEHSDGDAGKVSGEHLAHARSSDLCGIQSQDLGRMQFLHAKSNGIFRDESSNSENSQEGKQGYSLSSYYNNILTTKNYVSKWIQEKPFDEESFPRSEIGELEEVEEAYEAGVFAAGSRPVTSEAMPPMLPPLLPPREEDLERMMSQAKSPVASPQIPVLGDFSEVDAAVCVIRPDDDRKNLRQRAALFCCPLVLAAVISAVLLAGTSARGSTNKTASVSSVESFNKESIAPSNQFNSIPSVSPSPSSTSHPSMSPSSPPTTELSPAPSTSTPSRSPIAGPTPSPARAPLSAPVPNPTLAPLTDSTSSPSGESTENCINRISVDKTCYEERNDIIIVEFELCDPREEDWVGLWLDGSDPKYLGDDYRTWAWTCGTQRCDWSPVSNRFGFRARNLGLARYRVFLVRDDPNGAPYQAQAMSDSFVITNWCQ